MSDDNPSCNTPVTDADIEGIRDGASEAYYERKDVQAYWDLRMIARIDAEAAMLKESQEMLNHLCDVKDAMVRDCKDWVGQYDALNLKYQRLSDVFMDVLHQSCAQYEHTDSSVHQRLVGFTSHSISAYEKALDLAVEAGWIKKWEVLR
jgi:hypothetical protein